MPNLIAENAGTIIVNIILLLIIFFAVKKVIKDRKNGGCSCGCAHCAMSGSCKKGNRD